MKQRFWFTKYFKLKRGKCYNCGKRIDNFFCCNRCLKEFTKKNKLDLIQNLRKRLFHYKSYFNWYKAWSFEKKIRIPLNEMEYNERINNKSYNKAVNKMDEIAIKIKRLCDNVEKNL